MKKNYILLIMVCACLFSLIPNSYGQLGFRSTPVTTATVGAPYTYSSFADDGTSDAPTMTCPTKPAWMNFAADGSTSSVNFGPTIASPAGIAGDADGNTYVLTNFPNNSFIYKIAPDGTANTTWAAVDNGSVYAMNVDGGFLYVSYYVNSVTGTSCIKKISLTNPSAGQTMVYNTTSQNRLLSLVFRGGYIYSASYGTDQILKIDPTTSTATVYVSTSRPFGLGFNANGLLYIANYTAGTISTYDGTTLVIVKSGLANPSDVKIDSNGNVYVSFYSGGGIIKYNAALTTEAILVPIVYANRIWGMNLTPTGSLIFGLNSQNTCARIGTGAVLSGTPTSADIGTHNVRITATSATETVDQDFVVTVQGPPTITDFPDLNGTVGTNLTLTDPTSNSAGGFTYTSSDPSVATISGNTVTPVAAGTTTITATQASSGNYTQGTITSVLTVASCTAPVAITKNITVPLDAVTGSVTVNAADINDESTGDCGALGYMLSTGTTGTVCATTGENGNLTIAAPAGSVFTGVTFASYGTPDGSCGSFTLGGCNASNSASIVSSYLIGQNTATIPATNAVFGDPCGGTPKRLYVEATYGPSYTASKTFSYADIGDNNVIFKVTDGAGNIATGTAKITVQDVTAPVITCPADITVNNDSGICGAVVDYQAPTNITFSESFIQNQGSTSCGAWNTFQSQLLSTLSYKKLTIKGSLDLTGVSVTDPAKVLQIANALRTGTSVSITDGGRTWITGGCGDGVTLSASGSVCNCEGNDYVVRPCIQNDNPNWGGAGTATCGGVSQTITVEFELNGSGGVSATDNCDSNPAIVQTAGLPSGSVFPVGTTTNTFKATDASGNTSSSSFDVVVTDNQIPVITSNGDKNVTADLDVCGASVVVSASATDNCTVGVPTGVRSDALALDAVYPVGTTTIKWNVSDANSNAAVEVIQTVIVTDNQLPVITSNGDKNVTTDLDVCGAIVTVSASASDNCTVDVPTGVRSDALALDAVYPVGTTTIKWNVSDANSNAAVEVIQTVIVTDNQLPVITSNGDKNVTTDLDVCGVIVTVSASASDNCTVDVPTGVRSDALALDAVYPVGTTTITWNASDSNGNAAVEVVQTVIVTDNQLPVITSNGDKNVTTDLNVCGASVVVSASATDNCTVDAPTGVRSDALALDAVYPVGTTTITWNASDNNGNDAVAVIQTVIVVDNALPTVITKNITVQLNTTGNASIVAADVDAGATDACGIATLSVSPNVFTCANVGANTVTLKATDVNGNVAIQTATVTIEDKVAPIVLTKNITVQLNIAGNASIVAADVDAGTTDACGIATLSVSPNVFTCANVGANTVTLKATDVNGNVATQTATVTIEDKVAPIVLTKNSMIQLDASGNASITAAQINNGSTDNCGIASISLSKLTFSCANVGANTVILTVRDVNGNVATASAVVTVVNTFGDNDSDGIKDNCDDDDDNDGVLDGNDNCSLIANANQADNDQDILGDVCDDDDDNDGILDTVDNCPMTYNPNQEDRDHDGLGDLCDLIEVNVAEAVTPNGDGVNDTWVIYNIENHPNSMVRVFNRWGTEVFSARNYRNDWDGHSKNNSQLLPEGSSYYYQIDFEGDGTVDKEGWIYINR